jgi:histone-lysine N-methyltransferase SETMAR
LIVHADNARPHTAAAAASQQFMEENEMARATHPPYSPDLAPSDFYLFGCMKHCLRGQSFEAADELFSAIEGYRKIDLGCGFSRMDGEIPEMYCTQW